MKQHVTLLFTLLFGFSILQAQTTLTGSVYDSENQTPLPGASVMLQKSSTGTETDFDGNFSLEVSEESGTIVINYLGYDNKTISFNGSTKFDKIMLTPNAAALGEVVIVGTGIVDLAENRKTPVAVSTIRAEEIQLKNTGNVEFGETIKNTPSVYVSSQAGGFGDGQVFLRGFNDSNTAFLLNGQPINGQENGRMFWSNWSGMSDVANAVQVQRGLGSSKLAISSVGGTVNIISKTTDKKEGGYVRFLGGNDSYLKSTANYNSGISDSGWAFSVLVDHWQAHRKYAIGTAGAGQNYLFSVGYVPNDRHSINLLITGAPQWHDQNFSDDLENYALFGERHNDNSGFLNGERYTERRNYYHKPVANLNWDFTISENIALSTVLYASWGRGGGTGNLGNGRVRNPSNEQIDFDQIVENNIASANDGIGNFGDSYIRRSSVNNHNWYGLLSSASITATENLNINVGFDSRLYHGDHFRQVNDLLGLEGYNDNFRTDRPSDYVFKKEYAADPWSAIFKYADEANRTQYDYSEDINYIGGFGQIEYATDDFSIFLQGALSNQTFQREGRMIGRGEGLGESEKLSKIGYNIKGGVSYNLNEKHTVFANTGFFSRQPFLSNIFQDIRYSNAIVEPEVDNEEITSYEFGYRYSDNNFRLNLDVYHTTWGNRFLSANGREIDANGIEINYIQRFTDIAQVHKGVEFDFEYKPDGRRWNVRGYASFGNWEYRGRSPYTIQNDDTGDFIEPNGNINLEKTKIGNAPQTSMGLGFFYKITDNLSVDTDYNVYTDLYEFVDTEDVTDAAEEGKIYQPESLGNYDLVDAGLTYKFKFGENKITFRGNVKNVFNSPYISQRNNFGYYLGIGRTWNASIRYNF